MPTLTDTSVATRRSISQGVVSAMSPVGFDARQTRRDLWPGPLLVADRAAAARAAARRHLDHHRPGAPAAQPLAGGRMRGVRAGGSREQRPAVRLAGLAGEADQVVAGPPCAFWGTASRARDGPHKPP